MFDAIIPLKTYAKFYSVTRFGIWAIECIINGVTPRDGMICC